MNKKKKKSNIEETNEFEIAEVLAAEYEYIAQTAFQAHEDRSRVTSFYVVSLGSLFGAFLSTGLSNNAQNLNLAYLGFAGLFVFLSYFGYITLMQLVYLRKAWFESARAMNQIKDFLIEKDESLKTAFRWKTETLPGMYKKKSVAFLLAKQVAYLGAITAGAAAFYLQKALYGFVEIETLTGTAISIPVAVIAGFIFAIFQTRRYRKELES